jgi:hypothetical protein
VRIVLAALAVYYLITGIWPIVSLSTFEAVTGPKTDDWLVHMVGLLAATVGAALLVASWRRSPRGEMLVLAVLAAVSFAAIDLIYALNGTISRIYLADAVIQIVILVALAGAALFERNRRKQ